MVELSGRVALGADAEESGADLCSRGAFDANCQSEPNASQTVHFLSRHPWWNAHCFHYINTKFSHSGGRSPQLNITWPRHAIFEIRTFSGNGALSSQWLRDCQFLCAWIPDANLLRELWYIYSRKCSCASFPNVYTLHWREMFDFHKSFHWLLKNLRQKHPICTPLGNLIMFCILSSRKYSIISEILFHFSPPRKFPLPNPSPHLLLWVTMMLFFN